MMYRLAFLLSLFGCGHSTAVVPPSPTEVIDDQKVSDRLPYFYDRGFVVSRDKNKAAQGQGDSAIFTGEAVYALDCARGAVPAQALADMMVSTGGAIFRHPDIQNQASLDSALGVYRGIAKRVAVCGESDKWRPIFALHLAYMDAHGGLINAGDVNTLPLGFDYVRDRIAAALGLRSMPTADAQAKLEGLAGTWAGGVMLAHAACYRLHLGLMAMQTVQLLGDKISDETFAAPLGFCANTRGSRIPTVDNWCGRGGLPDWLSTFAYNTWQYRHQRCTGWETPDAGSDEQPAIDYLVGWADEHGSPK